MNKKINKVLNKIIIIIFILIIFSFIEKELEKNKKTIPVNNCNALVPFKNWINFIAISKTNVTSIIKVINWYGLFISELK